MHVRHRIALAGGGGVALVAGAEIIAAHVFMLGTRLMTIDFLHGRVVYGYANPWLAWWDYLGYRGPRADDVHRWTLISAGIGLAVAALFGLLCWLKLPKRSNLDRGLLEGDRPRPVERAVTDLHGHQDWMPMTELRRMFPGPDPRYGGVVVGEAYRVDLDRVAAIPFDRKDERSWGQGGKADLLIDPLTEGSGHSIFCAGSGGFKTTSIIATMLHWRGALICLDPAGEIGPMVRRARQRMGQRVHQWSLYDLNSGPNVLAQIDPEDILAEDDVVALTAWICGDEPDREEKSSFKDAGRNLVAALLADIAWSDVLRPNEKNLLQFVEGLTQAAPALRNTLRNIGQTSRSPLARKLARTVCDLPHETFGGVYFSATTFCGWLFNDTNARFLSGSGFNPKDLANGQTSVFVQLPVQSFKTAPGLARVAMGTLMNAVYKADGRVTTPVFVEFDEAYQAGPMKILDQTRTVGRKYGLHMRLWYQSESDIGKVWGRDAVDGWFDSVNYVGYAAVQSQKTAKSLSDRAGTYGAVAYNESDNTGRSSSFGSGRTRTTGSNSSRHEVARHLIKPEEITQDMRQDEQLLVPRAGKLARCGRPIYFRRPEMVAQVDRSRFYQGAA
jgi:type IV secretion system protein VirD4